METLNMMAAYLPPDRLSALIAGTELPEHTEGTVLFSDISGFTSLTEALAQRMGSQEGGEVLNATLNRVFAALIDRVTEFGSSVLKFSGDALTCIFAAEAPFDSPDHTGISGSLQAAVACGLAMQEAMRDFAHVDTPAGTVSLSMKVGIGKGALRRFLVGDPEYGLHDVLAGEAVRKMAHAEQAARAGEVVLAAPMTAELTALGIGGRARGENLTLITELRKEVGGGGALQIDWRRANTRSLAAAMRPFIPTSIYERILVGQGSFLADLRPVTMMFAGFRGIDFEHDPHAAQKLDDYVRAIQRVVARYDGRLNEVEIGDKGSLFVILFGAPVAHEDDTSRAISCAHDMRETSRNIISRGAALNIEVRVGVTQGHMFAGRVGSPTRWAYTVVGDDMNLAARLMVQAQWGQVLGTSRIRKATKGQFEMYGLGDMRFKGKAEPIPVFEIRPKKAVRGDFMLSYLLREAKLIGREAELQEVERLLDAVWDGQGRILLVSGDAGVGKSCFVAEIVRRFIMRGGIGYGGDSLSYGRQISYLPWCEVLASACDLTPKLTPAEQVSRIARILRQIPEDGKPPGHWMERLPLLAEVLGLEVPDTPLTRNLSGELRRDNTFALIEALLLSQAHHHPILVLLDDIHWSDVLSLELAAQLGTDITQAPVCFILAHRPLEEPIAAAYQRLQSLPHTKKLELRELSRAASAELVCARLGVDAIPPVLEKLLWERGQGNPFFIEELVKALESQEVLKVTDGAVKIKGNLENLEMPDDVGGVVLARLDRLPEDAKLTLKVAAVIGRLFQKDLLGTVHPMPLSLETLDEQLAHLLREDFTKVEVQETNTFIFRHVITQEVAYDSLLFSQRRKLHRAVGQALEAQYAADVMPAVERLAHHYELSDDQNKAINYIRLSGDKAFTEYANDAAEAFYTRALEMWTAGTTQESPPITLEYELLSSREAVYNRLGKREAQVADLARMQELAERMRDTKRLMEMQNRAMCLETNLGEYDVAVEIGKIAQTLAQQTGDLQREGEILLNLGIAYWRRGDMEQARLQVEQARQVMRTVGDQRGEASCLSYLGLVYTKLMNPEKARECYEEALEIYRNPTIRDRVGEAFCANNLGLLHFDLGLYEQARESYQHALRIRQSVGDRAGEGISLNTLGLAYYVLGDLARAQEYYEESLKIRRAIEDRRGEAFCLHDMGMLYLSQGEAPAARAALETASGLRRSLGEQGNYIASLVWLGLAYLAEGRLAEAHQSLRRTERAWDKGVGSGEYPPQQIWWAYWQIHKARGETAAANNSLRQAHKLVQEQAVRIQAPELRGSFLNIQINREIGAAWEELAQNRETEDSS